MKYSLFWHGKPNANQIDMSTFIAFIIKETRHIVRDRRTLLILMGMPVVMMLLFGFAITTEVRNVRLVIVTSSMDKQTQAIADRLDASSYFNITACTPSSTEAKNLIQANKADMAIVFSQNFANHHYDGQEKIQIIADCADPNMAIQQTSYAKQIIAAEMSNGKKSNNGVILKLLYNPRMESAYNFVPGVMGMILMIICAMMTAISIVREKERGTMEVLLVSPIRPILIIIAKIIPYLALGIIDLSFILVISHFILNVPIAGSFVSLTVVSVLFIIVALSLGLFISVSTNTQVAAMLASGMILLMPCILLSGMIYPIESMPRILQLFAYIVPASWFISACKKIMIMGVSITMVWKEISVMAFMATLLLIVSLKKFKKRLE
jgi:ABC-2 type transport system permease protein